MADRDRRTIRQLVFIIKQRSTKKRAGRNIQTAGIRPLLARPHADTLNHKNQIQHLKELRIQHRGRPFRIFFAFDPQRQAVLLCGGDKTGNKRFYQQMLPIAVREFSHYLATQR